MNTDSLDGAQTVMRTARSPVFDLREGDRLGDYQVIRPLGAGGMGQVYEVENVHMRKRYALKLLPQHATGQPAFLQRFRTEARVMADLHHPHIVQVHGMGEQEGRYYLVMDYVAGEGGQSHTLSEALKEAGGALPEARAREVAMQVCDALHYAHHFGEHGILHRDLKPDNVLLDADGNAKVTDFGLAKVLGDDYVRSIVEQSMQHTLSGKETLADGNATWSGSVVGTYDYMAPEQRRGEEVTRQTDVFALGVMLYQMLTGKKPEGRWKLPSQLGRSAWWDGLIEKCLEPEPSDRWRGMDAIKTRLQQRGAGTAWTPGLAGSPDAVNTYLEKVRQRSRMLRRNTRLALRPFAKCLDFKGRSSREEYWMFSLLLLAVVLLTGGLLVAAEAEGMAAEDDLEVVVLFLLLAMLVPCAALAVRRLHDLGHGAAALFKWSSGWHMMFKPGTPGDNPYGPDPREQ